MLMLLIFLGLFFGNPFSNTVLAAGTDAEGYTIITTAAELDTGLRSNLSGKYRLGNDIDFSNYTYNSSTWTSSKGWKGIGETQAKAFKGILDGNGFKISGLWSSNQGSNQGLFGWLSGATVKNLTIELAGQGITGGGERKGGLAGNAYAGAVIENVHVAGSPNSVVNGSANYIAGLVGVLHKSRISSSSATNISASGCSYVGGLVGAIYGGATVEGSSSDNVTLSATASYAGGLIGYSYENSKVAWSHADNITVSTKASYVGGFIGGSKQSTIERCYVMGVNATASASYAGGFAGVVYLRSNLTSCYSFDADVKAAFYAGGLVGTVYDYSTIQTSCSYGKVQTTAGYIAGGFAGEATNATISNCYAQVDVRSKSSGAGGLIAYAAGSTSVNNCYAAGSVSAGKAHNVGAFTGHSNLTFMGANYYDSDLTGPMNAYGTGGAQKGSALSYPQGKDTANMKQQATFLGWDFVSIWRIDENVTYPYFWDWGWWIKEVTVAYDKNADDATGEMVLQAVPKDTATNLNANQFVREDYVFLGWSASQDGDIVYEDSAPVTLSEDITLYAIWGTPSIYYSIVADCESVNIGETVNYSITLGNADIANSVTLYRATMDIYLSEYISFVENSIVVTLNGSAVTPEYTYNDSNHTITVNFGTIDPGEEYKVTFGAAALASGEDNAIEIAILANGSVTPLGFRTFGLSSGNIRLQGEDISVRILLKETEEAVPEEAESEIDVTLQTVKPEE